jgi:hypothetical protein
MFPVENTCSFGALASLVGTLGLMAARYRCASCGNLTRFDVVATVRTKAFHHYTVGGQLSIEDREVLAETIESVTCRWCGHAGAVEALH